MTVAGLVPALEAAMQGRYGVMAINIANGLTLRARVNAAEQLWAPVIVQTSVKTVLGQGVPETISMFSHAAHHATVHEVLHLTQCPDRSCCARQQFAAGHAQSHYSSSIQEIQGQEASEGRSP